MATRLSHVPLKKEMFTLVVVLVVVVAALASAGYFYVQYQDTQKLLISGAGGTQNPALAQEEVKALVNAVGKLMLLPEGEQPTLATVSDKSKLAGQPFFARSENGDKVLIYQGAKKAILYRPSNNKIIEVSTVNIGESSTEVAGAQIQQNASGAAALTSPTPIEPVKIAIFNGTATVGLTKQVESKLKAAFTDVNVISRSNANSQEYTQTMVVALSPQFAAQAQGIAKVMNGVVKTLPSNETKPENADILIIAGEDFE